MKKGAKPKKIAKSHREMMLEELASITDPKFKIPKGLYIPLGNRVLIKEIEQEEHKTASGLIVLRGKLVHTKIGIVYRIGENVSLPIKPGMVVAFASFENNAIMHEGEIYIDVQDFNISAVVPPKNYMPIHVKTNKELRTDYLRDRQNHAIKRDDAKMDEINNG